MDDRKVNAFLISFILIHCMMLSQINCLVMASDLAFSGSFFPGSHLSRKLMTFFANRLDDPSPPPPPKANGDP